MSHVHVGSVAADGRMLHVMVAPLAGRVMLRDHAEVHSGPTLHADQARKLGELLATAADASERARAQMAGRSSSDDEGGLSS